MRNSLTDLIYLNGNVCTWRFLRSAEAERVHIHLYKKVHLRKEWETYIYINVYSIYYFFIHQRDRKTCRDDFWWFVFFFSTMNFFNFFCNNVCVFFLRAYPCFKKKVQEGTRFAHTKRRCVITDWSCRGWFAICYTREISCNEL